MTTAHDTGGLPASLQTKLRAAKRSLWLERVARCFWPLWVIAAVAFALAVLEVFTSAPQNIAIGLAAVLGLGTIWALWRGFRQFERPTRAQAMARLDDGLAHRSVTMLDEDIAVGRADPEAQKMWDAHRKRLTADAAAAKNPDADLRMAPFDTWNLRYAAIALAVIAWGYSRVGGIDRVAALLDPTPAAAQAATLVPTLEAWAAPPPYTGAAPIYLTERTGEAIRVPTGSVLTMRATGIVGAPVLSGIEAEFSEDAPGIYGLTHVMTRAASVGVAFGEESVADWQFSILPDMAPEVEIADAPEPTAERGLGFSYLGKDDYGIVSAKTSIIADRSGMDNPPDEIDAPIDLELGVPSLYAEEPEAVGFEEDFTEHPLAGSPVQMVLQVTDAAEQSGESEVIRFTLPARVFTEPMAKALIEQRRALAWDIRDAWDVLDLLEAVTDYPDDYFTDTTAALATSTAIKRLTYALEEGNVLEERAEILDLLWKAAMRLEEGDLSNALERGASDEELERLMDEMRQAMNNYLDEMMRQAQRDQQNGEQQQGQQQESQSLSREDLERMLDEMEKSAKDGAREQAEQMLSMLGEMLENLQMGQSGKGGEGQQQEQALQDMMRRQQELADETFRQLQDGQNGQQEQNRPGEGQEGQQQPGQQGQQGQGRQGEQGQGQRQGQQGQGQQGMGNGQGEGQQSGQRSRNGQNGNERGMGNLSQDQEGLRDELGRMMPGMNGEARDALGDAEREMGAARDRLQSGDLNSALDDQARALDRLREGAQALAEENRQQAEQQGQGQEQGQGSNADSGQNPDQLDPFGRVGRTFGPDDGDGVEVPGQRARNRAQEIQREIRRRQAERDRPEAERDYLDRLQERF